MSKMQLYYWDIRALGEPIRLMLEYLGVEYENKHPTSGEEWFASKFDQGIDFPNLPYLIDGDKKIPQSYAIMRYLTRKYKSLGGGDSEEQIKNTDVAEGFCNDLRMPFYIQLFMPNFEENKANFIKDIPKKMKPLELVLAKGRKWSAGDQLSYVDFAICENLDHYEMFAPGCLDASPHVKKYKAAFDALPKIAAYRKSDRFQKWPVTGGTAKWGSRVSMAK